MTGMSCTSYDPTFDDLSASAGEWVEAWVRCTASAAGTLSGGVAFAAMDLGNRNDQVLFDNVRVTVELLE
jgi:hypothetical protein